jgi:translation elongation factor EF-1beta
MNKKTRFSILLILLIGLFFACKPELKNEIFIKSFEIGIYYDSFSEKTVVLNSGKHNIPSGIFPNIYPIEQTNIKRNVQILTKDEKPISYGVNYWYSVNPKNITEFRAKVGNDYVERYVLPKIYSEMRKSFRELDSMNIEIPEIEKEIESKLNNDIKFSEFIKTKSIKFGKTKPNKK